MGYGLWVRGKWLWVRGEGLRDIRFPFNLRSLDNKQLHFSRGAVT